MLVRQIIPFTAVLNLVSRVLAETSQPNTGDQLQGFLFSYPSSAGPNSVILPLTPSCPSPLTISSLTSTNNPKIPDPVAPYTLVLLIHEQLMDGAGQRYERMYTRSIGVGNMEAVRSIQHPWMNGTQFIGCIWASNGVSGGCQDLMTVSTSELTAAAYVNSTSACRTSDVMGSWVPPASSTLDVKVEHSAGLLASNGWPPTCSDLRITPQNGTAPYTLLIAPAFHPPVNITSSTKGPMNYTVRLTHGQALILAVFDSAGNSFAFGPLHAGHADNLGCLAVATGQEAAQAGEIGKGALAGGIVGAFLLGAVGAAILLWGLVIRKRDRRRYTGKHDILFDDTHTTRPFSFRLNSDQSAQSYLNHKPIDPYIDSPSPHIPYESPEALYDPHMTGTGSSGSGVPRPPGGTFSVTSRGDFGPTLNRIQSNQTSEQQGTGTSRGDSSLAGKAYRSSGYSDRRLSHSLPSSTLGSGQHRHASEAKNPPTGLRLSGTPTPASPSANPWDGDSDDEGYGDPYRSTRRNRPGPCPRGGEGSQEGHGSGSGGHRARKVYVVHSDGGDGDVHIQLPNGDARVIELPPNYPDESSRSDRPSTAGSGNGLSLPGRKGRSASSADNHPERPGFGPRPPRPTSSHSSIHPHTADSHPPSTIQHSVNRRPSEIKRIEAAYLDLDLSPPAPPSTEKSPAIVTSGQRDGAHTH